VVATVALFAVLAAVQVAAPFHPIPSVERNVIVAAMVLAFTVWVELALTVEFTPAPGLLLVIQFCWLLAVLGPAVQPESLRPQVLGNVLVSSLLPVKVASGFLYLLCLPALLRLWPLTPPGDRRARPRFDAIRALCWFPYCALFTTLFFPPSADDVLGLLRFVGSLESRPGHRCGRRDVCRGSKPAACTAVRLRHTRRWCSSGRGPSFSK
jgi:hypothetical protein